MTGGVGNPRRERERCHYNNSLLLQTSVNNIVLHIMY